MSAEKTQYAAFYILVRKLDLESVKPKWPLTLLCSSSSLYSPPPKKKYFIFHTTSFFSQIYLSKRVEWTNGSTRQILLHILVPLRRRTRRRRPRRLKTPSRPFFFLLCPYWVREKRTDLQQPTEKFFDRKIRLGSFFFFFLLFLFFFIWIVSSSPDNFSAVLSVSVSTLKCVLIKYESY